MKRVLVVGDIIKDVFVDCSFRKKDPSTGVQALVERDRHVRPGGAANVAVNLCALSPDARVTLIGCIDYELARQVKFSSQSRLDLSRVHLTESGCLTKTRYLRDNVTLVRIDNSDRVDSSATREISLRLDEYLKEGLPDLILLSDYGHESVDPVSTEILLQHRDRLLIDTKRTDLERFEGSLLCKLNQLEWDSVRQHEAVPEKFFKYLVVTLGPNGALLHIRFRLDERLYQTDTAHFQSHRVEGVVDVCGCGDTFLAGFASSYLRHGDPYTAVKFANAAAATVVTQRGTAIADLNEALRLSGLED